MARPSSSYLQLVQEGKSHMTKHELEVRKKAEESMLTGNKLIEFDEVKKNKNAHAEFIRVSELLSKIDKNDAIFTGSINRYCLLAAECKDIEKSIKKIKKNMLENSKKYKSKEINYESYINIQGMLETKSIQHDKQLQTKRKMMFDIEKENLMTIAGSLRCVPKRVTKETKSDDDLFD